MAQAATEQVVLLHSIRRWLMWGLVVVPLLLVALSITLVVIDSSSSSSRDCGTYGTLC